MKKDETIFGTRAVIEAIKAGREIEKIFIQTGLNNDLVKELISIAREKSISLSFIPQQKLNKLSNKNHQGVVCMLSVVQYSKLEDLIDKAYSDGKEPFFVILDRITDVRNFGAISRTADCAGITGIIIPDKGNAPITGDAMKTSAGALSFLPVSRVSDLKKTIADLKSNGIRILACTEKASQTLYETDLQGPLAIIMGSEEDGISQALIKDADHLIKIPMYGNIASLNVSVAAGIALFEVIRQKHYK
ncbi:MAG TPA: 23S rRNA (guanosine(2251)-2'-O)-methyltransferase RlmB [Cyclobacteriaceae bacterium]|nr:23S rRNA (guanosine(2251)-2'-O)-methyltransferase RlmB [Cyclobacteriaceae bacterium]